MQQVLTYAVYAFLLIFILGALTMFLGIFLKKQTPEEKAAAKAAKLAAEEDKKEEKATAKVQRSINAPLKRRNKDDTEFVITDTRTPVFQSDARTSSPLAGFASQKRLPDLKERPPVPAAKPGEEKPAASSSLFSDIDEEDNILPIDSGPNTNTPKFKLPF